MDDGVAGIVQTLVGVIIGGFITLATTAWVEGRRARHQAAQRRAEQAESAAQEIATTLMDLRNLTRRDIFKSQLSTTDQIKAEEELERRIELLSLRLTDPDARHRIQDIMDLSGWATASPEHLRFDIRDHLIECCGSLMRGEAIPPEPPAVRTVRADVADYIRQQNEGQEALRMHKQAEQEGWWRDSPG